MKKLKWFIPTVVLAGVWILGLSSAGYAQQQTPATGAETPLAVSDSVVQWITFEEALEKNKTEPRKWIIDLYTDWCGWCKKMDKETFTNPYIGHYINQKYYAVKFNAEQKERIIVNADTFDFVPSGTRGYHALAAALTNGNLSYPTLVYLRDDLALLQAIGGYQTPQSLEPILKFFGNDTYLTNTWELFMQQFKSELPAANTSVPGGGVVKP